MLLDYLSVVDKVPIAQQDIDSFDVVLGLCATPQGSAERRE
jgi:hypothetical protein